jgi:hypothetical protein
MRLELFILCDSSMFVLNRRKTASLLVIFFYLSMLNSSILVSELEPQWEKRIAWRLRLLKICKRLHAFSAEQNCSGGYCHILWKPSAYQYMLNKKFGTRAAGAALRFGSVSNSHKWCSLQAQLRLHKHCCSKWCKMIFKRGAFVMKIEKEK